MRSNIFRLLLPSILAAVASSTSDTLQSPLSHDALAVPASHGHSIDVLAFHQALVEHPSISGAEGSVGKYLAQFLSAQNLTVEIQRVSNSPWRANILAYAGTSRQTRTLVTSHIDTVPPYIDYERRGTEIWGRGSVDAKASVAAQVAAVLDLLAQGSSSSSSDDNSLHEGDVALLFVVGEEVVGDGMRAANALGLRWDTVIFGEPTELKLAAGHKGMLNLEVRAHGKAAHSGYPELGRSANAMLVAALAEVLSAPLPWSDKYGNSTLNIGRIEGGVAANVIAEEARAAVAVRIAAGEPDAVRRIVEEAVARAGYGDDLEVVYSAAGYGPVAIDADVEGFESIVVNYGTDIPNLEGSHKRYLYGPGAILVAHSDHEHLPVADLFKAIDGYKVLIKESLRRN